MGLRVALGGGKVGQRYEFGERNVGVGDAGCGVDFCASSLSSLSSLECGMKPSWSSDDVVRYSQVCKLASRGAVNELPLIRSVRSP